jgi:hypothetical protein
MVVLVPSEKKMRPGLICSSEGEDTAGRQPSAREEEAPAMLAY